ncbi:sensor histidine kinase [Amycolatopsis sp. H20-H5]|uniref:sensor histidine kinase n=1 Tax=Amycolatopsis sp. H20-H5 TaxID=3046309 RepID=UPI002DB6CF81|nr:ATP-binding protein [Amycolatopsis sp. H20-H5]MEC3981483.1 ATP-binding protein [Amycolatopsis sp. H20-H5]
MATRARGLLDRSRVLLDRSRVAAAQFLVAPPKHVADGSFPPEPEAVPAPVTGEGVLAGICSSVSLRDLNLVDQLLAQLEEMEANEDNAERLTQLYRLDHLATRLRRNAENLRVLAGRDTADDAADTSSVLDVTRAAMSSIDHYSRVTIGRVVSLGVVGFAAEDLGRLLAELLDNAANQSSPNSAVSFSAHLTEQGSVLIRIEDEGIGLPPARIDELNRRLAAAPILDDDAVRHMGLAVVGRLAHRHGITVRLDRRTPHGTIAVVLLPAGIVSELAERNWSGSQTVVLPQAKAFAPVAPNGQVAVHDVSADNAGPGLPRRTAGAFVPSAPSAPVTPKPTPRPRPSVPDTDGSTPSGLPRRLSRSIRPVQAESEPPPQAEVNGGHDRLLADLDAFSDGEQAALDDQSRDAAGETDRADGGTPQ